jgi:hypothetical protein
LTKTYKKTVSLLEYEKELISHDFNFLMVAEMNSYAHGDIPPAQLIAHGKREDQLANWAMLSTAHGQLFDAWVNYITRDGAAPRIEIVDGEYVIIGNLGHEGTEVSDGTIYDWRKQHIVI